MEWVAVVQQLNRDLLAIEMMRSGLLLQQRAIRSVPLLDPATQAPVSKAEFKELGSADIIVEQVAVEAVIGLTANVIETFAIRLGRHLNVAWDPFSRPRNDILFADRVRQFRALNNVFKHQEGYVEAASSRSAKFLVDGSYFQDKTYLKHLSAESIVPRLELALFETFAHLYELSFDVARLPNRLMGKCGVELVQALRELAVYPIIEHTLVRDEN